MSDDSKKSEEESKEITNPLKEKEQASLPTPKSKIEAILQSFELFALEKGRSSIDLNSLSEPQRDKLIDTIAQNEENAFKYHIKRLEVVESIESKRIHASTVDKRTFRYVSISILSLIAIITILILFFKDEYLQIWLAFIIGIVGGAGGIKLFEQSQERSNKALISETEKEGEE